MPPLTYQLLLLANKVRGCAATRCRMCLTYALLLFPRIVLTARPLPPPLPPFQRAGRLRWSRASSRAYQSWRTRLPKQRRPPMNPRPAGELSSCTDATFQVWLLGFSLSRSVVMWLDSMFSLFGLNIFFVCSFVENSSEGSNITLEQLRPVQGTIIHHMTAAAKQDQVRMSPEDIACGPLSIPICGDRIGTLPYPLPSSTLPTSPCDRRCWSHLRHRVHTDSICWPTRLGTRTGGGEVPQVGCRVYAVCHRAGACAVSDPSVRGQRFWSPEGRPFCGVQLNFMCRPT